MFETYERNKHRKTQQRNRTQKGLNGNCRGEKYNNWKKKNQPSVDGPNSRMEGQRKEFVIWKINQQKLANLNKREKINWKKKMSRPSGTCGTITRDVIFVLLESQKKRRKATGLKTGYTQKKLSNLPRTNQ